MTQSFQPSLCEPAEVLVIRTLLRRCPTVDSLQAELAGRLVAHLASPLSSLIAEAPDAAPLNAEALASHIVPLLVQVEDSEQERVASIGACRLRVRITRAGSAASYWATRAPTPTRALHEALNCAEWVVMLAPELRTWIQSWLIDQPWFDDLWPVERHEMPRRLGIALAHALEAQGPCLKALLLLQLGYPVDFLDCYLRELGRGTPHPTLTEIACLLANWDSLRRWPWRARKMAWLALPLREAGLIDSLEISAVRSRLRELGLTRNAWARLHRLPLAQLRDLGLTLDYWQAEGQLPDFLQALGFVLSRLGPANRFYQAWHAQVPEVLSDIPSRLVAVQLGRRAPVFGERQQWYRLQRRSISLRMLNGVVPGGQPGPEQVEKAELFLTAVARYLLQPSPAHALSRRREELSDLVDWFRAGSATLPAHAFKGEVPALLRQSRQWHERMVAERERREVEERQRYVEAQRQALPPARMTLAGRGYWQIPLREHAWMDYRYVVLRNEPELIEEAAEMKHCVDTYVAECVIGECRIVSIRWGTRRVATMELRRSWGGLWQEEQLKGARNALIPRDFTLMGQPLRDGIEDFLQAFNAAARRAG